MSLLGVDYGMQKVGLALAEVGFAQPLVVVKNNSRLVKKLAFLVKEHKVEKIVLGLFYNRFYDLYDELSDDNFFKKSPEYRFLKIREIFSIYKELIGYE
ncbi:Holliday junction resolvase RuvX, partial [Patescibacteria group bacterium]|nr:Holliday junction resolvase RuvX [Patescibacteria group bacterium]